MRELCSIEKKCNRFECIVLQFSMWFLMYERKVCGTQAETLQWKWFVHSLQWIANRVKSLIRSLLWIFSVFVWDFERPNCNSVVFVDKSHHSFLVTNAQFLSMFLLHYSSSIRMGQCNGQWKIPIIYCSLRNTKRENMSIEKKIKLKRNVCLIFDSLFVTSTGSGVGTFCTKNAAACWTQRQQKQLVFMWFGSHTCVPCAFVCMCARRFSMKC